MTWRNMMTIANPIYDTVFKYLMEDERIARTILSALLKEEIVKVEGHVVKERLVHPSIFRMDFKSSIMYSDGALHEVTIVLKKIRFEIAPPFFLLTKIVGAVPYTHYMNISVPSLSELLKDRYFKALNIFHQMYQIDQNKHVLNMMESVYAGDGDFEYILSFLSTLLKKESIKQEMRKEDNYIFLKNHSEFIKLYEQFVVKDGQLAEKDGQLRMLVKMLVQSGQTVEAIAESLKIDKEAVKALL